MRSYGQIIRESALRRAAAWKVGEPFVMQRTTQAISLDIILRAVFGLTDPTRLSQFERALVDVLDALSPAMLFSPLMQRDLGPLTGWRRFSRLRADGEALVRAEVAARRDRPGGDDILSLMLAVRDEDGRGMADDELLDELNTLLLAGHETTAIALAWAFYWLLRTPDALARLQSELAELGDDPDPEAVAALPFLDAVCHEVLRLYPIIPMAPRTLLRPLKLGRYDLAPGTSIGVAISLIHEHPDLYPEPDRFKPERFLGRKPSPFEFVPFGGGHRRCIGAAFAMYELKLALAAIVPAYRLKLLSDVPARPVRRNLSLGPRGGVAVVRVA
jgi:cytochrome P450